MRIWALVFVLSAMASLPHSDSFASEIYLDAKVGQDLPSRGSQNAPLMTLEFAWRTTQPGDRLILLPGEYSFPANLGRSVSNPGLPADIFDKRVEIVGTPDGKVVIKDRLVLGADGRDYYGERYIGTFAANMRLVNLLLADGISAFGARNLEVVDCKILTTGPWTGSEANISKAAIRVRGGRNIRIERNEITDAGIGVAIAATDSQIVENHIHNLSQDGIQLTGSTNLLVDGNTIENLDDGVDDGEAPWNKHCDGIHFFMTADREDFINDGIVLSRNRIFHVESQGVQFNNYKNGEFRNRNILFENNIFGPARSPLFNNAEPADGLIFRHNTVVLTPENVSYQSRYRMVTNSNFRVRFSESTTGLEVYNNILVGESILHENAIRLDHNLYLARTASAFGRGPLARGCVRSLQEQLVSPYAFNAKLRPDSAALDGGTRLSPAGNESIALMEGDFYSTARDNRPDFGAFEQPFRSPPPETLRPAQTPAETSAWADDFTDGDFLPDPYTVAPTTAGIGWSSGGFKIQNSMDGRGNQLSENPAAGNFLCLMNRVPDLQSFRFSFSANATTQADGGGPAFLFSSENSFLWLRLGIASAALCQVDGDVSRVLLPLPGFEVGSGTSTYIISVKQNAVRAAILINRNGAPPTTFEWRNAAASHGGEFERIGFYRSTPKRDYRLIYDDIRLERLPVRKASGGL